MTGDRQLERCDGTRRLIDRVVAERVTPEDRAHAATCEPCGRILSRATRFDDELRTTARGLVAEQLPQGVLDRDLVARPVAGMPPMRHAAPGLAGVLIAAVILAVAASVAVAPGGLGPGATPSDGSLQASVPVFRGTVEMIRDLAGRDYSCIPGHALPTTGPSAWPGEREGVRCLTPKSLDSATATLAPVENGDGEIVEVAITGSLYGNDTLRSRDQLATTLGDLTAVAIFDPGARADAAAFVREVLPRLRVLPSGDHALMRFGDVRVILRRYPTGGYLLLLQPA